MNSIESTIEVVKEIVQDHSGGIKGVELIVELWERDQKVDAKKFDELLNYIEKNNPFNLKVLHYNYHYGITSRSKNFIYSD